VDAAAAAAEGMHIRNGEQVLYGQRTPHGGATFLRRKACRDGVACGRIIGGGDPIPQRRDVGR